MSRIPTLDQDLASIILHAMEPGIEYDTNEIADMVDMPAKAIYRAVKLMEKEGYLLAKRAGPRRLLQRPVVEMVAARVAPVEAKPLTGYDLGSHMRLCQGSRKPDTGMT
jgi:DNA-binding Lrp family transcriptional regulator